MNTLITTLTQLASDSELLNESNIESFIEEANLSAIQKAAIEAKDLDILKETIRDLPDIKCVPLVPAEDDEENQDDNEDSTDNKESVKLTVNC